MLKLSARWLKNDYPNELEFEGVSEANLSTRTAAQSAEGVAKRYHSPKELVALGIAGCTGVDVVSILKKMRQPLEDLSVDVELEQTTEHPRVFSTCQLVYRFQGQSLERDRVARATALSYGRYCGVSAMIKRSGCHFELKVFLNDQEITPDVEHLLVELANESSQTTPHSPRAALLITGNEILAGKTQDTNGRFLSRNLRDLGLETSELRIVGDDRARLLHALTELITENDVVLMTGGLGPTKDDLTAELVATAISRPLIFSQEAWIICTDAFKKLGRTEIPESNKKQALLPEGAIVLNNSMGTAAGFALHFSYKGRTKTLIALPGVPWECESMFEQEVKSLLPKSEFTPQIWGPWNIWGMGESAIQSLIQDVEAGISAQCPQMEYSFQAHAGYVTYSFKTKVKTDSNASVDLSSDVQKLEKLFDDRLLYKGQEPLVQRLIETSMTLNLTVSVAESCTGGRIACELTSFSGSSQVFLGGVVAYSNELKRKILGVSEEILKNSGAVSIQTAASMAHGAAHAFESKVALSVTGISGPSGGSEEKPVGLVCFGLSLKNIFLKERLPREKIDRIFSRLLTQGWVLFDENEMIFVSEKKFGAHLSRDVLQKRAVVYGLCSLVAVAESMRGETFE